jgi:peptide/nickel transport system substrate-binding protein/oligopeptide transport system substrate-binding protein
MTYLEWDRSPTASPLDSLKVRQAIAMAINRTPLVNQVLYGMGGAAMAAGPKSWAPTKYEHALPYNVREARKLLTEAGYPGGKGIPELALYTQTVAANPGQVQVAEALASELKSALGITFKIEPTATNEVNAIVYNGLEPDVTPGYVLGGGNAGWIDASYLPLQTNQLVHYNGALGNLAFRQYAEDWYFDTYDARDVKAFGNPNDPSMGVKFSQWAPLQAAALKDIAYLNAYNAKQPKWYQEMVKPAPGQSNIQVWDGLVQDWKQAKTAAAKHSVWVTAWKFVGSGSLGNGNAEIGLNAEVYTDEHEGPILYQLNMEDDELGEATSSKVSDQLTGKIVNTIFQQGWDIPLYYGENIYLSQPDITNVDANPFGWTWWGDLQYLNVK